MKKIIKASWLFLAVAVLLVSQMNLSVFATDLSAENEQQTEANQSTENNETVEAVEEEDVISDAAKAAPLMAKATPFATGFASYDGIDLDGATTISYDVRDAQMIARTLLVKAVFDGSTATENRQIKIRLGNGLGFRGIPGMTYGSGYASWSFNAASLPTQLQGIITNATFTPDASIYGYNPQSGELVFDIAPGTTAVTLELSIALDTAFSVNSGSKTFSDILTVKTTADVAGVATIINEEKIESYTITGSVGALLYSGTPNVNIAANTPFSAEYFLWGSGSSYSNTIGNNLLFDSASYTLSVNKKLGFVDVSKNAANVLSEDQWEWSVDRTSDPVNDLVTITYKGVNLATPNSRTRLKLNFLPGNEIIAGETYSIRAIDSSIYAYNATAATTGSSHTISLNVAKPFQNILDIGSLSGSYVTYDNTSGEDLVLLGGYHVSNSYVETITGQSFRIEFNDPNVGVRYVRLAAGNASGATLTNVVAKTNKGNTYTVASLGLVSGTASKYGNFVLSNYTSDPTEYITEVTYDSTGFTSGYGISNGAEGLGIFNSNPTVFYGHFLNKPADMKHSFKVSVVETADGDFDGANAKQFTPVITIKNDGRVLFYTTNNISSDSYLAGNTYTLNATYSLYPQFGNTTYPTKTYQKGLEIYLREDAYLQIDSSTLNITASDGTIYAVSDGTLVPVKTTDNDGEAVYKLTIPDLKVGYTSDKNSDYSFKIAYDFKVKNSAPTITIPANELIYVKPLGGVKVTTSGNASYYNNPNKYDVDGSGATSELMGTLTRDSALKIQAQKDFTVTTAANLNNGPWVSYDHATNQSIIDLNPEGDAKYQLTVANNSGSTINGYTALVPIPKAGEKTDLTPATPAQFDPSVHLQKEAFSWTASLLNPVTATGSLSYQVLYATTYETDKDSAAFVPWSAITDPNEIRMVKITTNDAVADGFSESITFPLALTDPDADLHAGMTNIYSARIHREIMGTAGYKPSEPIAIRLKTGVIKGQVFNDTNRNGLKDAGETGRNGVTVVALEAGTTTVIETTTTQTINGVPGSYAFLGLDKAQNVDIVFTNPNSDDTTRFSPVTSGGSTPTATATHDKATTAAFTPSSIGSDKVDAGIITPIKVTFNPGGGSVADETLNRYPGEAISSEQEAVKTGHTFTGWFTAATGGSKVTFPYTVGTTDITLYAQYTANKYVLSYDVATNGGTGTAPADEQVTFDTLATAPADAVKTGYTFTGWFDSATGGTKWNFATSKMPANAVKLYAQFTINSYTMTFDNEGATTTQTVVYDTVATEPTAPSKTGFTFAGWFDAQTGGTKWNFATDKMPASNKTLYAQYTRNNYTVTFNDQGTTTTQTVAFDALVVEPATVPTKAGYTFAGWFDAATGGTKWNFGTDKMPATNKTLYAQFTADDQNITFDANGGTGAPATLVQPTDSSVNLDALTAPTRAGYTFVGWFDASDVQHSGTFAMPVGGLSLKAKWTADDQVISFNTNGGTGVASITAKTDTTVDLDTVSTSKAGYQFDGWFVGTTQYTGVVTVPAGGLALEAHWTALDQTITFDVNGGNATTQPADIIQVTDSAVDLDAVTAPTWFGHKFLGWKDASGTTYSGTITMPAGGLTLIAEWQDLIVDGVWQIEANNISMSIDEFRDLVNQGTLEQEVLNRSNARAWNEESGEAVEQVYLQWDSFNQITTAGTYIANVYVADPMAVSSAASNAITTYNENIVTLNTNIQIELYANPKEADGLPTTGINSLEMLLVGLVLVGLGLGAYRKLNRK